MQYELTGAQKRRLRALAHTRKAIVMIGKQGLTDAVVSAANEALSAHELVNVKITAERDERERLAADLAARRRDGFDERKRHFTYFMGIVRNKQKELDKARLESRLDHYRAQAVFDGSAAQDAAIAKEDQQERTQLATEPEKVILKYSDLLMRGRFRLMRDTWLVRIREGLKALRRLGRTARIVLENLMLEIRGFADFEERVRDHMGCILAEEFAAIVGT